MSRTFDDWFAAAVAGMIGAQLVSIALHLSGWQESPARRPAGPRWLMVAVVPMLATAAILMILAIGEKGWQVNASAGLGMAMLVLERVWTQVRLRGWVPDRG